MIPQDLPARRETGSYRVRRSLTRLGAPPVGGVPPNPVTFSSGMVKGARRGVFFCAVVGGRTYLRFVSADETWGVSRVIVMVHDRGRKESP